MKTSYFFSKKITINDDLVSIAGLTPKELKYSNIRQYDKLKPSKQLVMNYKSKKISEKDYIREYNKILNNLDAKDVYLDLKDSILLCWEKPNKFCHRHLVSKWLNSNLGLDIKEL